MYGVNAVLETVKYKEGDINNRKGMSLMSYFINYYNNK